MNDINENYIINRLNAGSNLNIIFMSHNAYWPYIEQLAMYYQNCKVQVFGKGTSYLLMSPKGTQIDDCDLINLYATHYSEYELSQLKEIAHKISKEQNKVITIGYSYIIPSNQTTSYNSIEYEIKLVKINQDIETENTITGLVNLSPLELVNLTLIKHDEIPTKILKKV